MMVISLLFNQKEWYIPKHSSSVGTVDIQYQPMEVLGIMLYVWSVMNQRTDYYVYLYLREDGTPYYVGKGKDDRAFSTIRRIRVPSRDRIVFPFTNLTEEESLSKEKELIAKYGRKDIGTGILRNLTDGGEGSSGAKRTPEQIERLRLAITGKKRTPEQIERIKKASQMTPEKRQKLIDAHKRMSPEKKAARAEKWKKIVREMSPEKKAAIAEKLRNANIGKKHSPETIEKMRKSHLKENLSEEKLEKMRISGKKNMTPERIEQLRLINTGRKHSEETRKKISEMQTGRKQSPEHVEKNRQKSLGKKHSPETIEKMRKSQQERRMRNNIL